MITTKHSLVVAILFVGLEARIADAAPERSLANPQIVAASPKETVLKSETVRAVFEGWDDGDPIQAKVRIAGRQPVRAWSGSSPIDLFLDSHRGKQIVITINTLSARSQSTGRKHRIHRIVAARHGKLTAAAWWRSLSLKQRQDAQISLAGALEPKSRQR
jgi:hypothetical protein